MDNNIPANQTAPAPAAASPAAAPGPQPIQPQPAQPQATIPQENSGGNKLTLWFIIGLVIVIAIVGGIYFYLNNQKSSETTQVNTTAQVTPAPTPKEDLEGALNNIDIDEKVDSEFTSVDSDLGQL